MPDTLKTVFKRIQDGVAELGDALLGDRIERALDQDIREVDQALHVARHDAATIKAGRIRAEQLVQESTLARAQLEDEISALLRRRRKTAAREKAARLVVLAERIGELEMEAGDALRSEARINHLVEQLEHKLRRIKHQLGTLRATTSIQRAQAAVAKRQSADAQHPESAQAPARRLRNRANRAATPGAGRKSNTVSAPREQAIDQIIESLSMQANTDQPEAAPRTRRRPGTPDARKAR